MTLDEIDLRPFYKIFNAGVMQHYQGKPLDPEFVQRLVLGMVAGEIDSIDKSIASVKRYNAAQETT